MLVKHFYVGPYIPQAGTQGNIKISCFWDTVDLLLTVCIITAHLQWCIHRADAGKHWRTYCACRDSCAMYRLQSGLCMSNKPDLAQQSHVYLSNSKPTVSCIKETIQIWFDVAEVYSGCRKVYCTQYPLHHTLLSLDQLCCSCRSWVVTQAPLGADCTFYHPLRSLTAAVPKQSKIQLAAT